MVKKTVMFFASLLFIASVCFAQAGQTGAINGTVSGPEGQELPGITVILKSPQMVLKQMTTVSNTKGFYRFPALTPGTYEVTFMLEGMDTIVRKGIIVTASMTATVDVKMQLETMTENIVVAGQAPTIDRQSTTGASNMDEEFLKSIPAARNFFAFFNMTPGVTGDTANGSATMDNSYNLDGVNMGDPATGLDFVSFGMDIMEEVSVQAGGLTAEYGSVKGAVVNVITKSGGNDFSGAASFYLDHESLQSDNTEGTPLKKSDEKTGKKYEMEPVLTLGGPVIKDKLWFFTNLSMIQSETYAPGYPARRKPGTSDIPQDNKQYLPYGKLTFHPSQKNKFVFSYNYSDRIANHRGADRWTTESATAVQSTPTHTMNLHWTHFFGNNVYANLKLAYIDFFMSINAKQPGTQFVDYLTSISSGSTWRNKDENSRKRYQANLDGTTFVDDFMGSHEIKLGAEYQGANVDWLVECYKHPLNGVGYAIVYPEYFGGVGWYQGYVFEGFNRKETMMDISAYLQDTWSITSNLTLNLGVRFDNQNLFWPKQNENEAPFNQFGLVIDRRITKEIHATNWSNFSPRVGFIYDIFSDGSTLFKASYSRYVQPNQVGWINGAHPNGWYAYQVRLNADGSVRNGTQRPFWTPSTTDVGYPGVDLIAPTADEITVGIERELWEDWSMSARFIKKWDWDLLHTVDGSRLDIDGLLAGEPLESLWIGYEKVELLDPFSGKKVTFYNDLNPYRVNESYIMNPPGAERRYDGLEVTLSKRYSKGWAIDLSYVYADSQGLIGTNRGGQALGTSGLFGDPNAHINMWGRLELERRHQFKFTGLLKGPLGINVSGYFRYMSGNRWTRNVSSDYLGYLDILGQGNTNINAETRGYNGHPDFYQIDLRLEKAFRIDKWQIKVFADAFNVLNSNITTGVYSDSSHPTQPYNQTTSIMNPRVVRLGAKIEFN